MKRSEFKIEVCANSVESVKAAAEAGADRPPLMAVSNRPVLWRASL